MRGAFPASATQVAPDDLQGIIAAAVTENIAWASSDRVAASPGPLQTQVPCSGPLQMEWCSQQDASCPHHRCFPHPKPNLKETIPAGERCMP